MQDTAVLAVDHGLRERINLGITVPYRSSRTEGVVEADVEGLGDIGLQARFGLNDPDRARWAVSALALASFPTGEVETGLLDENIVLGVGAVSLGAGAEATREWPRHGTLVLRLLGSKPTGPSDEGVRFGGALNATAGYGRPWRAGGRARWAVAGAVSWTEPDERDGEPVDNRGGRQATLTAGLSVPMGKTLDLAVGAQRLVAVDVHGDQLEAPWSGFLGIRWLHERPLPPPVLANPPPEDPGVAP